MSSTWLQCLNWLRDRIPFSEYNLWIRPLQAHWENEKIVILTPNWFVLEKAQSLYQTLITQAISSVMAAETIAPVQYRVGSLDALKSKALAPPSQPVKSGSGRGLLSHTTLRAQYQLQNFVVGAANELAFASAEQTLAQNKPIENPLVFYGPTGTGKTHLLHALGNGFRQRRPNQKICYMHSEFFVRELVKAFRCHSVEKFKQQLSELDVLLLDEVQLFEKKVRSQEELCLTIQSFLEAGKPVIVGCDRHPKDLEGLNPKLRSCLSAGLAMCLDLPDAEMRFALLSQQAEKKSLLIDKSVLKAIAEALPRGSVREIEGALARLECQSQFTKQTITLDFALECLKTVCQRTVAPQSLSSIQRAVASYYRVGVKDLLSPKRTRLIVLARQMAMALSKKLTDRSSIEIGAAFGCRTHSTVLHACKKIAELKGGSTSLQRDFSELVKVLGLG